MISSNFRKIKEYKEFNLRYLKQEELENGGYKKWYDDLKEFRKAVKDKYISINLFNKVYRNRLTKLDTGDLIDHHILSYLAPLELKNIGFGGQKLKASEEIKILSEYFKNKNKRFIYVAIPNKCCLYPELIFDNAKELLNGKTHNSPQYRKYLREIIESDVEVIDILPVFKKKDNIRLFSRGHHVSSLGDRLIAETISNYLEKTSNGITNNYETSLEYKYYYNSAYGSPEESIELCSTVSINKCGQKYAYRNQDTDNSQIACFGDCNLQEYSTIGGGICANITNCLKYPVRDAGRKLIFGHQSSYEHKPITKLGFDELSKYDIIIYVAFASAPFVRMAER